MRKHTPGHPQHVTLALVVVLGLCEETVYNKRPLGSYAGLTWRTGWPCCPVRTMFPWCSMTVSEAVQRLRQHLSKQPADKQRAGYHFRSGLGSTAGVGGVGSSARHATQGAIKASRRSQLLQAYFFVLRCCSVQSQRMPGSSCSAACQDAHRAAPSCVTAPPSLFGGRPCSSWTWSAVSPNVRTGGRRPR